MSDMFEYEPGVVYENLILMLTKYRGATLSSNALSPADLQLRMNRHGYAHVVATRVASEDDPRGAATIHVLLVAPGHDYSNKAPKFKMMLAAIAPSTSNEIIVVTSNGITSHIKKVIEEYNAKNTGIIYDYDYHLFIIEVPKHNSCEHHELVSHAAADKLTNYSYSSREDYPKIKSTEAHGVWLGLRPGMFVRITRASKSAGVTILYRVCVK